MDRDRNKSTIPQSEGNKVLCEELKNFFHNKVVSIYSNLQGEGMLREDESLEDSNGNRLKDFTPITGEERRQTIVNGVYKKECEQVTALSSGTVTR